MRTPRPPNNELQRAPVTKRRCQKKGFHSGPIILASYFGPCAIIFHGFSVGSHYPFNRHQVPHFLTNITPIFTPIFPVLVLFTPIFPVFMLRATLLSPPPQVFLFLSSRIFCRTLELGLVLRGSGFGTQLLQKIGSLAKTFLLAPSLNMNYYLVTKCLCFNNSLYDKDYYYSLN